MYYVIDLHTKAIVGTRATRKSAMNRAEKLNLEYSAHRYSFRMVIT